MLQSCLTLCSLPGSFTHGIFQARVLEWVAIAFSDHLLEPRFKKKRERERILFLLVKFLLIGCREKLYSIRSFRDQGSYLTVLLFLRVLSSSLWSKSAHPLLHHISTYRKGKRRLGGQAAFFGEDVLEVVSITSACTHWPQLGLWGHTLPREVEMSFLVRSWASGGSVIKIPSYLVYNI